MIMAEHELCEQTVVGADQEAFNSHLNLEQVNKVSGALGAPTAPVQCQWIHAHSGRLLAARMLCCLLGHNILDLRVW